MHHYMDVLQQKINEINKLNLVKYPMPMMPAVFIQKYSSTIFSNVLRVCYINTSKWIISSNTSIYHTKKKHQLLAIF